MTKNTEAEVAVEQRLLQEKFAHEAVSAANIVSHDGYYELDIEAVADVFARFEATLRHRLATEAPARADGGEVELCSKLMAIAEAHGMMYDDLATIQAAVDRITALATLRADGQQRADSGEEG